MKTVEFITKVLVEKLNRIAQPHKLTKMEARVLAKEIEQFKMCKTLLSTNPSEQFIRSQLDKTVKFVDEKMKEFYESHDWSTIPKKVESEMRSRYMKKWDIAHKKDQIRFMRFLLD